MFIVNELRRDQVEMRMDRVDVDRVLEECARPPAGRPLIRDQSGLDLRENALLHHQIKLFHQVPLQVQALVFFGT